MSLVTRAGRIVTIAVVLGVGISQLVFTFGDWHLSDMGAYWNAGERLRLGEPLYPPLESSEASEVYRYAPWFAWVWAPLTTLPRGVVNVGWSIVLLAASAAALLPLVQVRAWLAVAFFLPILVGITAIGNVQPLVVAMLVLGLERRTGPLWIGVAASLKAVPILFVLTYLGRRQWLKAAAAAGITAVLVAPMLLHDLSNYPAGAGQAAALAAWPPLYGIVVAIGIVASLRLARGRHAWLASAATATVAVPRLFVYDVSLLMAAVPWSRSGTADGWVDSAMAQPYEDAIMAGARPHHEQERNVR